jgi:hypothetical protein
MLSDALHCYPEDQLTTELVQLLAAGCLSSQHAGQFSAFARNWLSPYTPEQILSGEITIPYENVEESTFMLASVRAHLMERLPENPQELSPEAEWLVYQTIELIEKTAAVDAELVRYFITPENEDHLPRWLVDEITQMWVSIFQLPQDAPPMPTPSPFSRPTAPSNQPPAPPPSTSPFRRSGTPFGRSSNLSDEEDDDPTAPSPFSRPSPFRRPASTQPSQGNQT